MDFDVLVIGGGPAGSAAARRAATHGLSVALVDRAAFPREKVCGDGLIPDALTGLRELGLSSWVLPTASRSSGIQVFAPDGRRVRFSTDSACIARRELDDLLRLGAMEAGAQFIERHKVTAPILEGRTVAGAVFSQTPSGPPVEICAKVTILATGASAGPLDAFGVCRRPTPSATAARMYVEVDPATAAEVGDDLLISYDAATLPGYGWIFPGPRGVFNVGFGYFYDARRRFAPVNLRVLLERFLRTFPAAVTLMRGARTITPLRGAPIRTAMQGADLARPGLLVAGDAAGLTYSLTGEGIGKALQSGMLAADLIAEYLPESAAASRIARAYPAELAERFGRRFRAYRTAQNWVSIPPLGNFLAARATRDGFVKRQIEALLADEGDPRALFSLRGMLRAVLS